jgi:large subunit ribosomal protein L9
VKLILTQQVSGLGAPGDVVEVKGGYGRNYLIPRGYAMQWSRGAEKQIASIRKARAARQIASMDQAQQVADDLAALKVTLRTKAGESGRLFGSVTAADIVAAVKAAGGPDLDRRRVEVANPIKTVGSHRIAVRLHPEVSAALELDVVAS